jgi:hypothetical protein
MASIRTLYESAFILHVSGPMSSENPVITPAIKYLKLVIPAKAGIQMRHELRM